ncbi:acyltransferase (plasmid) [Limimaricola variabilis]|uniref:acyltransferase n=1 Tax=Limimaricola variabilis TaxID=1492771 RepID=UPI002AC8C164|nr:acyltransferase [Limimaricola variabilis]WPY96235.1 acyltransferase [Limimaricola variabilis]
MSFRSKNLRRIYRAPEILAEKLLSRHPSMRFLIETKNTQTPISFRDWYRQEVRGINRGPYWPVHPSSMVTGWRNVLAGIETSPGAMPGCYIQALGPVILGDYTQVAPNVSIISSNHKLEDLREHDIGRIEIGEYSWLGAGAVVLPNVTLGPFTVVAAGAVLTKPFPEGYCVLAGIPARVIKRLEPASCPRHRSRHEYHGFVPRTEFEAFRAKELLV